MDQETLQRRRAQRARERRRRHRRRWLTLGALAVVIAAIVVVATGALGSLTGGGHARRRPVAGPVDTLRAPASRWPVHRPAVARLGPATGHPGHAVAPILMYHVINDPPPGAPYPGLYVPASEFAAQMRALKAAGYVAVTLDQLRANWRDGARMPHGRPIVITFDNGYRSQYTAALPILRRLGWAADENIQLTGLPPSQGGLTAGQVRGLIHAGWELDTQGISHADLVELDAAELHVQVAVARRRLQRRFGVPVRWFCYPSGQYDPTVVAAVRAAGFVGSTTVVPGWATRADDPYELPRLRILGGTSPAALLDQIDGGHDAAAPPASYETSS